jgi:hypothetical protein
VQERHEIWCNIVRLRWGIPQVNHTFLRLKLDKSSLVTALWAVTKDAQRESSPPHSNPSRRLPEASDPDATQRLPIGFSSRGCATVIRWQESVAQLVEHRPFKALVLGSSPSALTINPFATYIYFIQAMIGMRVDLGDKCEIILSQPILKRVLLSPIRRRYVCVW